VKLTKAEVDFLAGDHVASLIGGEPRTVKRLINVYRIIRARLNARERAQFLGTAYPLVATMIAVETGQPIEVADALFAVLISGNTDVTVSDKVDASVKSAVDALVTYLTGSGIAPADLKGWALVVRRFSFNEYAWKSTPLKPPVSPG
jgi:hypothetical protein